jgi:hypothetical protein
MSNNVKPNATSKKPTEINTSFSTNYGISTSEILKQRARVEHDGDDWQVTLKFARKIFYVQLIPGTNKPIKTS